jgi:alpha-galactosidase
MNCTAASLAAYKFFAIAATGLFLCITSLSAQTIIPMETSNMAMVLKAGKNKDLEIIYFGKKLNNTDEYALVPEQYAQPEDYTHSLNSAYTAAGSRNLAEPAITVTHADGNNSLNLKYVSHNVKNISDDVSLLTVQLKDPVYDFEVSLFYKSFFKEDVVEQWSLIKHHEKGTVILQKFSSYSPKRTGG